MRLLPLGCMVLAIFASAARAAGQPAEQTVSASRQFIVYGMDVAARGALCQFAEQTKRELLALLRQPDRWSVTIIVNAQRSQVNLPEMPRLAVDVAQTGFGLKLRLDAVLDSGLDRAELRREVLRALLLEMIYRGRPNTAAGTVYVSPPDWFLEGVPGDQSDLSRDRLAALLALPVATGNVVPLDKLLIQQPEQLDGPGRTLYGAYAFALVDLLRRSANGPQRLMQFLLDLPASSNDAPGDLGRHFPELLEPGRRETAWRRHVATLSADQPYRLLGSAETERQLNEMLRVNGSELSLFPVFLKDKSARFAISSLSRNLRALATRAHPVYAPVIAGYEGIVSLLVRGRTLDVPKRLDRLAKARKEIALQMRQIDDYLNWFEATKLAEPSGKFDDYLKAADRASQPARTRRDAVSIYLDALEAEFEP